MPRQAKRNIYAKYHHIMIQGLNKDKIFDEVIEIRTYKKILRIYLNEYDVKVIAYCFMLNHMHLILFSEKIENISRFMQRVNAEYAVKYNKNKERVGYVFRNRFRAEPIYDNVYLKQCIAYIHNNPVKAGICLVPSEYNYSSYNEILLGKSDLISTNIIFNFYENLEKFKTSHYKVKLDKYLDTEDDKNKFVYEEIDNILLKYKINTNNVDVKLYIIKPLIRYLIDRKIVSKLELSEYLKISLYKIRKTYEEK